MPLDCKDIPVYVWKDVREKWAKVQIPSDIDWTVCSLCEFMNCGDVSDKYDPNLENCENCPLFKYGACTAFPLSSKLHILYYWVKNADVEADDIEYADDIKCQWIEYIKKFLGKLDKLIEELES